VLNSSGNRARSGESNHCGVVRSFALLKGRSPFVGLAVLVWGQEAATIDLKLAAIIDSAERLSTVIIRVKVTGIPTRVTSSSIERRFDEYFTPAQVI
jgi:hypothetical protein